MVILRHVAGAPIERRHLRAIVADMALGRLKQSGRHVEERRLAAAGRADEHDDVPASDRKIYILDSAQRSEIFRDVVENDMSPISRDGIRDFGRDASHCGLSHQIHEVGRANPSPSRTTLLVECVETFLGIIELDDVADRLDHILDRAAVLKIVRPHERIARELHHER